jgi:hypothetical protein
MNWMRSRRKKLWELTAAWPDEKVEMLEHAVQLVEAWRPEQVVI